MQIIEKLWGRELVHQNNSKYCMKTLELDPGGVSSLHYHRKKDETFLCFYGQVMVEVGEKSSNTLRTVILNNGDSLRLLPGTPHRFRAMSEFGAMLVEASTPHRDSDVVRLEPSRKVE